MLKVFKELVHKDACDPEQSSLLNKPAEAKRKKYHTSSSSKSRSIHPCLCGCPTYKIEGGSSGSEHKGPYICPPKNSQHTYVKSKLRNTDYCAYASKTKVKKAKDCAKRVASTEKRPSKDCLSPSPSQSDCDQTKVKKSRTKNPKKPRSCCNSPVRSCSSGSVSQKKSGQPCTDDTCSAVSCALRRIITSQYSFVGYLFAILMIAIVIGILTYCHTMPILTSAVSTEAPVEKTIPGYFRLKDLDNMDNIQLADDNDNNGVGDIVANNYGSRNEWGDSISGDQKYTTSGFKETGNYLAESRRQEMTNFDELPGPRSNVVSLIDNQENEHLREFYRKLLETDEQIRNLKKNAENQDYPATSPIVRKRRSARHHRSEKTKAPVTPEPKRAKKCENVKEKMQECVKKCKEKAKECNEICKAQEKEKKEKSRECKEKVKGKEKAKECDEICKAEEKEKKEKEMEEKGKDKAKESKETEICKEQLEEISKESKGKVICKEKPIEISKECKENGKDKAKECKAKCENREKECEDECKKAMDCEEACKKTKAKQANPIKETTSRILKKIKDILKHDVVSSNSKVKRDASDHPTGITIQRKQVVVEFLRPDGVRKSKCSHVHSESRPHEKVLKHPYNQNTQRLDEFLEKFLEGNFKLDPLSLEGLFRTSNVTKCSHNKYQPGVNPVVDNSNDWSSEKDRAEGSSDKSRDWSSRKYGSEESPDKSADWSNADKISKILMRYKVGQDSMGDDSDDFKLNPMNNLKKQSTPKHFRLKDYLTSDSLSSLWQSATEKFGLDMTGTTLNFNPTKRPSYLLDENLFERVPNLRRLMQAEDDEEETLGYEDLKEVLRDDLDPSDDVEGMSRAFKRDAEKVTIRNKMHSRATHEKKSNSVEQIPNWKGPDVLLYPDEIISMVNQQDKLKQELETKQEIMKQNNILDDDLQFHEWLKTKDFTLNKNKAENSKNYKLKNKNYKIVRAKKNIRRTENTEDSSESPMSLNEMNEIVGKIISKFEHTTPPKEGKEFKMIHIEKRDADETDYYPVENAFHINDLAEERELNDLINDVENLEDYTNKNDKEENMAQAYSDYGVFEEKKDLRLNKLDEAQRAATRFKLDTKAAERKNRNCFTNPLKDLFVNYKIMMKEVIPPFHKSPKSKIMSTNIAPFFTTPTLVTSDIYPKEIVKSENVYVRTRNLLSSDTENEEDREIHDVLLKKDGSDDGRGTTDDEIEVNIEMKKGKAVAIPDDNVQPDVEDDKVLIENIAYKSRGLLSIENKSINITKVTTGIDEGSSKKETSEKDMISSTVSTPTLLTEVFTKAFINTTPKQVSNERKIDDILENSMNSTRAPESASDEKFVVKRNAPLQDSGLLFWNDVYDDEYGIKTDPLDDEMNGGEIYRIPVVKRKWFSEKMSKLKNMIRSKDRLIDSVTKNRPVRGAQVIQNGERTTKAYRHEQKIAELDNFEELTSRMREVCKKAAMVVQKTRNIKDREDESGSKTAQISGSLMRQLVQLMSDLVDFQVYERTCLKLPEDLKDFLTWLTGPSEEETVQLETRDPQWNADVSQLDGAVELDDLLYTSAAEETSTVSIGSSFKETKRDKRAQCLDSRQAVKELMRQYDGLSDKDKVKMAGVHEYLQDQLDFLNTEIATQDDYEKLLSEYQTRVKRNRIQYYNDRNNKRYLHRKFPNFRAKRFYFRNFGRKHTRSTTNNIDSVLISENPVRKLRRFNFRRFTAAPTNGTFSDFTTVADIFGKDKFGVKRNLQDVYYNAVSEAKKYTTAEQLRNHLIEKVEISTKAVL